MRWVRAGFLPVSMMLLLSAAMIVPLPLYVERPGRTVSLGACVDVGGDATPVAGDFLLTTINVLRGTSFDAFLGIVDAETDVVGQRQVLPPGVDSDTYFDQQRQVFASTAEVAAGVALEAAGFEVEILGEGVEVVRIVPNSPADGVLRVGDVIHAVGDAPVRVEGELRAAILEAEPEQPLALQIVRDGEPEAVEIVPTLISGVPAVGILPATVNGSVKLPIPVDVASGSVGGPSAGLMIALTVYDKTLPDVDLAAGRVIAGTGTLDQQGRIGPIGGISLKVLAADRMGADVFLAPAQNSTEAANAVPGGSSLRVVPVETFEQARDALVETAGEVPRDDAVAVTDCPYRQAS